MIEVKNEKIKAVLKEYKPVWAIAHAQKLMGWDAETYMPTAGFEDRGDAEGVLAGLSQKMMLSNSLRKKIMKASKEPLNNTEKGILRVLKREISILDKLPPSFVERFAQISSKARIYWRKAKQQNNFKLFQRFLQEIVDMSIKKAEYLGENKKPYNALLDLNEEGLTMKKMDNIFSAIKTPLKNALKKAVNSKHFLKMHPLQKERYSKEKMNELNHKILDLFRFDQTRGRIDVSAHPFTEEISMDDVRITTWFPAEDFERSLSATIHEFGHALYEMQVSHLLRKTPAAGGVSMGIHESQSRFWENLIGRNKTFVKKNFGLFGQYLPFLKKYDANDVYRYFNNIVPSMIRVEADEVTYNFHIMLRYEIEKGLLTGKIEVKDLPEIWNEKMQEYLGIVPKTDTEGVLQDIHWSMGSIGYFPTYTIGTVLASQIQHKMEKDTGKISELIAKADYTPIQEWLKSNIHQYGSIYTPKDLIRKSLGGSIDATYFIKHIREKVKELY
ncbi:carboxypeptidase M32 [Candidatus Woesearchaeota archaeon]|nr:MAG: carboxypeptidase M32 [Candidatus Woesearchaeota archaeon]